MSRTLERARGSGFRSGGMLRLGSMVAMLVVVWMLIGRARDPGMWRWLEGEERVQGSGFGVQEEESKVQGPKSKVEEGDEEIGDKEKKGATDESPPEWWEAKELFQAVSDGTTGMGREEMPAYWRLFRWAENQTLEEMQKRADGNVVLNQFVQQPDEQRGKLFQLDLNVRRVLSYPAPENSAGIETVYEVWGFTRESQAWLYVVLTAHLPPGMTTGPNVDERATFAGYFLKTQGYHAAGAGPKDKSLGAPLLIGRLARVDTGPPVAAQADGSWVPWDIIVVTAAGFAMLIWLYVSRRKVARQLRMARSDGPSKRAELHGWLAEAERGELKKEGAGGGDGVF